MRVRTIVLYLAVLCLAGCSATSGYLETLREDDDAGRRAAAAEQLGKLKLAGEKRDQVVAALTEATCDPSATVREKSIEALGAIGGEQAVAALVAALKGSNYTNTSLAHFKQADTGGHDSPEVLLGLARCYTELGDAESLKQAEETFDDLGKLLEQIEPQLAQQHIYSLKFGYDNLKLKYEQAGNDKAAEALGPKIAAADKKIEELNASGAGGGGLPFMPQP